MGCDDLFTYDPPPMTPRICDTCGGPYLSKYRHRYDDLRDCVIHLRTQLAELHQKFLELQEKTQALTPAVKHDDFHHTPRCTTGGCRD